MTSINLELNNQYLSLNTECLFFDFSNYFQRILDIYSMNRDRYAADDMILKSQIFDLVVLESNLKRYLEKRYDVSYRPVIFSFCNSNLSLGENKGQNAEEIAHIMTTQIQKSFGNANFLASFSWDLSEGNRFVPKIRGVCFSKINDTELGEIQKRKPRGVCNFAKAFNLQSALFFTFAKSLNLLEYEFLLDNGSFSELRMGGVLNNCYFGNKAAVNFIENKCFWAF